jgi:hypothetical protein
MKTITFFLLICGIIYPQEFSSTQKIKDIALSDSIKYEYIKRLNHPSIDHISELYKGNIPLTNFFFLDLNSDALIDIIYSGPVGIEENKTIIFQNIDEQFIINSEYFGNLISIFEDDTGFPLVIKLYDYACCDENSEYFEYYLINNRFKIFDLQLIKRIAFLKNTFVPEEGFKKLFFVTTAILELYNNYSNELELVAKISPGTKGIILLQENNNYLVYVSENSDLLENNITSGRNNEDNYSIIGWITDIKNIIVKNN